MNAASVLLGLVCTLGVFALVAGFIWLIFRGVEHEIAKGRKSKLINLSSLSFFWCVNAAIHINDESRWYASFYVVVALVLVVLTWREWHRERA